MNSLKYLLLAALLVCSCIGFSQHKGKTAECCDFYNPVSNIGIGVVLAPDTFDVYDDSLLLHKYGHINMYHDTNTRIVGSMFYKPDYGVMHYACIGKTNTSYKVIVNGSYIKYMPKTKKYTFRSWDSYILESNGVSIDNDRITKVTIYKEPSTKSDTLDLSKYHQDYYCPLEVNGNWLKIALNCEFELTPCKNYTSTCKDAVTGWIRWNTDNKLNIVILMGD